MQGQNMYSDEVAEIYQDFCESDSCSHAFQKIWHGYQEMYGEIESGSHLELLILAAMQYALDCACPDPVE